MLRMKLASAFLLMAVTSMAHAALNVFACEPEWGALAKELGGNDVKVYTATTGLQDPHHIQARPSLIAKMRQADLVVCTGAELEIGWLPVLLSESGNDKVQVGQPGYFEAARQIRLMEVPTRLDRSQGDIHAAGNPHIQTDPRNIARIAGPLAKTMAQLDEGNAASYAAREQAFQTRWAQAMKSWQAKAAPLRGVPVAVQHDAFPYMENWLGLKRVAVLEPKPGVDPSVSYLATILERLKSNPAKMVLRAAYQTSRPSEWLAERANIPAVELPFTVGGDAQSTNLYTYFDDTINRLLAGLK
jgi:zinc/manganese transport system substrate-binding protein